MSTSRRVEAHSSQRSRSRSPRRSRPKSYDERDRSNSPSSRTRRHHHHRHHHGKHRETATPLTNLIPAPVVPAAPIILPLRASPLTKRHYTTHLALFAMYLDVQKQLDISTLPESERRGRWKRFVARWNTGQLAEGWYDPTTRIRADESFGDDFVGAETSPAEFGHEGSSDEDVGPTLPPQSSRAHARTGPSAPTFADLAERDEALATDARTAHTARRNGALADRRLARERAEALAPRAEPGSRERMLEKRAQASAAARDYWAGKDGGGGVEEVDEKALGLSGEGGAEEVRRMRGEMERKRTDREMRREETMRARAAEREERVAGMKEKEDRTMSMLKALAAERFGGGG